MEKLEDLLKIHKKTMEEVNKRLKAKGEKLPPEVILKNKEAKRRWIQEEKKSLQKRKEEFIRSIDEQIRFYDDEDLQLEKDINELRKRSPNLLSEKEGRNCEKDKKRSKKT